MGLCKGSSSCLTVPPLLFTQHRALLEGRPNCLPEKRQQSRLGTQTPAPSFGFAKSLERGLSQTSQAAAHRGCNTDRCHPSACLCFPKKTEQQVSQPTGRLGRLLQVLWDLQTEQQERDEVKLKDYLKPL